MSGSEAVMPLASKGSLKIYGLGLNKLCKSNTLRKKEKTRIVFVLHHAWSEATLSCVIPSGSVEPSLCLSQLHNLIVPSSMI